MSIMFALLSSMLLGSADFAGGVAARRAPAVAITVWANGVGLVTALVVVLVLPAPLSLTDIGWGLLAGTCGSLGAVLLYRALALGVMSLVAPVTAASAAVIPVAVGAGLGERLSTPALVGVAGAVASMVLLCRRRQPAGPSPHCTRALILAMLAGVSFGAFLALLSQTSPEAGMWPLAIARCASLAILLSYAYARGQSLRLDPAPRRLAVGVGILDMAANTAFLVAVVDGQLAVIGLLASLSPLGTVLLARVMLRERLRGLQRLGTAMAMGSVLLLAIR